MDLPSLPDKQFLVERAVKRAQAALSPRDLELLWPSFSRSFRSVYEKRDPNKPAPKKDQVLSSASSYSEEDDEHKQASGKSKPKVQSDPRYDVPMLPGEASAILPYIQSGQRIPRRGEIGLTSETISRFEKAGYVMSGSRNAYMTAMRMKKENAVMGVEEERRLRQLSMDTKKKRELEVIESFRTILDERKKRKEDSSEQTTQKDASED